jgi:hypothetical protein
LFYYLSQNGLQDRLNNANLPLSPNFYVNYTSQEQYHDISWLIPGQQHTRNGKTASYSSYMHNYCPEFPEVPTPHDFDQILILSNGYCGSTCAVFSSHLGEYDHVESLVIGGIAGSSQQYFSFPGGEVATLTALYWIDGMINNTVHGLPPLFITGAELTFALEEIYSWSEADPVDTPLEFLYKPSTYRLNQWDFTDLEDLYSSAANFF